MPLRSKPTRTTHVSKLPPWRKREKIIHLDDLVLRRTLLAYLGQFTRPLVEELAGNLGESLGWNGERKAAEVKRTLEILADRHGVKLW